MLEKNSRIEVSKTPAEDVPGKKARFIKDGEPLHDRGSPADKILEKIAVKLPQVEPMPEEMKKYLSRK